MNEIRYRPYTYQVRWDLIGEFKFQIRVTCWTFGNRDKPFTDTPNIAPS